jgi:hypothetical protein
VIQGLAIIANVALVFLVCAYAVLLNEWVSLQSRERKTASSHAMWAVRARIFFIVMCSVCLIVGIVMSILRFVMVQITTGWNFNSTISLLCCCFTAVNLFLLFADTIFFAVLALTAFLLSFAISFLGFRTIRTLSLYKERNRTVMRQLGIHITAVGASLFAATIILIILTSVPYNQSVYGFLMIRLFVSNLIGKLKIILPTFT